MSLWLMVSIVVVVAVSFSVGAFVGGLFSWNESVHDRTKNKGLITAHLQAREYYKVEGLPNVVVSFGPYKPDNKGGMDAREIYQLMEWREGVPLPEKKPGWSEVH